MEIYAKGQLSYLILNCLLERDYYGLDIITEVKDRSNGRILLKKPSVYSNLNRMEKQGQVSSYVQSSDVGPNRRYYSITEKGRNTYAELKDYFDRNNIDVFRDFVGDGVVEEPSPVDAQPQREEEQTESNDFFDFSSLEEQAEEPQQQQEPVRDDGKFLVNENANTQTEKVEENRRYSISALLRPEPQSQPEPEPTPDPVFETKAEPEPEEPAAMQEIEAEQAAPSDQKVLSNQEIYDISQDMAKYRRKRSFAEDQMSFAVSEPLEKDDERTKANIEELKSSLLATKGRYGERMTEEEFYGNRAVESRAQTQPEQPATAASATQQSAGFMPAYQTEQRQERADDGVFITSREGAYPRATARKIEPPRLKVVSTNEPLPAPKKDSSVDLSHKEIISKLYSKSKGQNLNSDNAPAAAADKYIYDYEDLQDYYKTQGVSFRIYEKTDYKESHNTNKLNLTASAICLILSLVCTAALFAAFWTTGYANSATNFLYIAFPILAIAETGYRFYAFKNRTSWEPKPLISPWLVWGFTLLGLGAIVGINFAFGLAGQNFALFCNSLFLPAIYVAVYLPIYYYVKKTLYVKLWK